MAWDRAAIAKKDELEVHIALRQLWVQLKLTIRSVSISFYMDPRVLIATKLASRNLPLAWWIAFITVGVLNSSNNEAQAATQFYLGI